MWVPVLCVCLPTRGMGQGVGIFGCNSGGSSKRAKGCWDHGREVVGMLGKSQWRWESPRRVAGLLRPQSAVEPYSGGSEMENGRRNNKRNLGPGTVGRNWALGAGATDWELLNPFEVHFFIKIG